MNFIFAETQGMQSAAASTAALADETVGAGAQGQAAGLPVLPPGLDPVSAQNAAGQKATAGVLFTAWASPTGEKAVSANSPYEAWLTEAESQIAAAATQIQGAGAAFEFARAATPTPAQFVANNVEYIVLMATNIL